MRILRTIKQFLHILPKGIFGVSAAKSYFYGTKIITMQDSNEGIGGMGLVDCADEGMKVQTTLQYLPCPTQSQNDKKEYK